MKSTNSIADLDELRSRYVRCKDRLEKLHDENLHLVEQAKRLSRTEIELYEIQGQVDAQMRLYRQLYEIGKQYNTTFDLAEILRMAVQFVLYELNFERCLVLMRSAEENVFRVQAMDGYYDEESSREAEMLNLSEQEPGLSALQEKRQQVMCPAGCNEDQLLALGRRLGMDEYVILPLGGEPANKQGLLAAGNTKEMAEYQNRVQPDSESIVGLASLVSQANIAISKLNHYKALRENERKYRTLFEDSRDAIFIRSPDGQYLDVNQSMLDLFGYTREEIMRMNARDTYVEQASLVRFQQAIERTGSVRDFEVTLKKKWHANGLPAHGDSSTGR